MIDEDISFVRLYCHECENQNCPYGRRYCPEGSKKGCTRKVSEDIYDKFQYYWNEKLSFAIHNRLPITEINKIYDQLIDFLYTNIYNAPFGKVMGEKNKNQTKCS